MRGAGSQRDIVTIVKPEFLPGQTRAALHVIREHEYAERQEYDRTLRALGDSMAREVLAKLMAAGAALTFELSGPLYTDGRRDVEFMVAPLSPLRASPNDADGGACQTIGESQIRPMASSQTPERP